MSIHSMLVSIVVTIMGYVFFMSEDREKAKLICSSLMFLLLLIMGWQFLLLMGNTFDSTLVSIYSALFLGWVFVLRSSYKEYKTSRKSRLANKES